MIEINMINYSDGWLPHCNDGLSTNVSQWAFWKLPIKQNLSFYSLFSGRNGNTCPQWDTLLHHEELFNYFDIQTRYQGSGSNKGSIALQKDRGLNSFILFYSEAILNTTEDVRVRTEKELFFHCSTVLDHYSFDKEIQVLFWLVLLYIGKQKQSLQSRQSFRELQIDFSCITALTAVISFI